MNNPTVEGLVARLAELIEKRQKVLAELEHQREMYEADVNAEMDRLAEEERTAHARLRQLEECRRTLLDLQEEI